METNTSILILTPLLLPMADYYHIGPIHFGAMMLLNLQLGMLTPPFAANIFVACKVANVPFNKIIPPLVYYWLVIIPVLIIVTFVPQFSTIIIRLARGN
jgi:C4-dicarboxylate transporter DctM subunit